MTKPKIIKYCGHWFCIGNKKGVAGSTPANAYENWVNAILLQDVRRNKRDSQ